MRADLEKFLVIGFGDIAKVLSDREAVRVDRDHANVVCVGG